MGARDFAEAGQFDLFDEWRARRERLEAASDAVREKFGDGSLKRGMPGEDG